MTAEYLGTDEGATADPATTEDDTIVEQTDYLYDNLGNVILVTTYQRHDDATAAGAFTPATGDARVSYWAAWYDGQGRMTHSAEYGAADGFSRPDTPPARSDTVLVASFDYDGFGRNHLVTDPAGVQSLQVFDKLDRVTHAIANYKANSQGQEDYWYTDNGAEDYNRPKPRNADENQITRYEFDDAGQMIRMTVLDPAADGNEAGYTADNQVTRYVYSWELDTAYKGSPVPANHLLRAVVYPDSTLSAQDVVDILNEDPGAPSGRDFVEYTYHANGSRATMRDQRGVVHAYSYDAWNRLTLDHATDLGAAGEGVDGFVRGIGTVYDQFDRTLAITSYGDTNNDGILDVVRNQVQYGYDDYDAQQNPAGWGGVARVWQEHDGEVNTGTSPSVQYGYDSLGRLTSMTHPSGFEVGYDYGAAGSIDNRLSRVAAVTNAAGTLDYAAYTYLGAGTIVGAARQLPLDGQPDQTLNLTYGTSQNGYSGLDRFGRVVDQLWELDAASADHFGYGYTRAGNRLWRENVVAGNQNPAVPLDELYSYDELSRLIATERGRLVFDDPNPGDVSLTDAVFGQDWELDGLGNWLGFDDDGDAQTREHNEANEITAITGGWVTPAYDSAGNMILSPLPSGEGQGEGTIHYTYDAWNRLVAVRADDTGQPGDLIAEYGYDGLGRRIVKTVPAGQDEQTTDYYYNESWQLLEARTAEGEAESATHYVWDLLYIDAPIARLFDGNGDGDFDDAVDAVHYYTFDANQNVTALIGRVETEPDVFAWQVVERYTYTPYGVATAHDPDWSNLAAPTTDGPLYAGYHFDSETGLYHVRNRQYDAQLGTFTTRDPIGYAAGDANLYRYVGNDPVGAVDPYGLESFGGTALKGLAIQPPEQRRLFDFHVAQAKHARQEIEGLLNQVVDIIRQVDRTAETFVPGTNVTRGCGTFSDPCGRCVVVGDIDGVVRQIELNATHYFNSLAAAVNTWADDRQAGGISRNVLRPGDFEALSAFSSVLHGLRLHDAADPYAVSSYRTALARASTIQHGQDVAYGRLIGGMQAADYAGTAAGVATGAIGLYQIGKCGGRWAVARAITMTAATTVVAGGASECARAAGMSEEAIGGVRLAAAVVQYAVMRSRMPQRPGQSPLTTPSGGQLQKGATVYRVHGGASDPFGASWTTVDPTVVPNYRAGAGLFPGNTGKHVTVGRLTSLRNVLVKPPLPGPKTPPGALMVPEIIIPEPAIQVVPITTFVVQPSF